MRCEEQKRKRERGVRPRSLALYALSRTMVSLVEDMVGWEGDARGLCVRASVGEKERNSLSTFRVCRGCSRSPALDTLLFRRARPKERGPNHTPCTPRRDHRTMPLLQTQARGGPAGPCTSPGGVPTRAPAGPSRAGGAVPSLRPSLAPPAAFLEGIFGK